MAKKKVVRRKEKSVDQLLNDNMRIGSTHSSSLMGEREYKH